MSDDVYRDDYVQKFQLALTRPVLLRLTGDLEPNERMVGDKIREAISLYLFIRDETRKGNKLLLQRGGWRRNIFEIALLPKSFRRNRLSESEGGLPFPGLR